MGPKKKSKVPTGKSNTKEIYERYNAEYLKQTDPAGYNDWVNSSWAKKDGFWASSQNYSDSMLVTADLARKTVNSKIEYAPNVMCGRCKNYTVNYHLQQIRSADEPQTEVYKCASCKHQWYGR